MLGIGYDYDYYSLATARYRINFADSFAQAKALLLINVKCFGEDYVQKVNKAVVNMFEAAYPNDDMSYESLGQLCTLHRCISEDEIILGNDETVIKSIFHVRLNVLLSQQP